MRAPGGTRSAWDRRLLLSAGIAAYIATHLLLDWISLIDPQSRLGITPWNPPAGLGFALLLRYGLRFAPAFFVAIVIADFLFRDLGAAPWAAGAAALVIAGGYGGAAWLLRPRLERSRGLESRGALFALFGAALAAASAVAPAVVAVYGAAGLLPWAEFADVTLHFWVGDVLGIAVLTPFLLLSAERSRWPALADPRKAGEYALQLAAIALGLWVIFGLESANHFEFSYALFLPLIWIALRDGLMGAAWGVVATQIGVIAAIQVKGFDADTVAQFQLLMLAVALTGIFLGAAVDERQRAEGALRESEARLQTIVSTAPDAILTFDDDGRILSANRAAGEIFGGGLRALAGGRIESVLPGIAGLRGANSVETTARRIGAGTFPAEVSLGRSLAGGHPIHVAVVRDISARKQAEAVLQQHETRLAQAARLTAAGEMAAGLAHELNQPLTAAVGFARACEAVLDAGGTTAQGEARDLIAHTVQQALRAGEIIRRTREFLRRGDMRPERIAPAELVKVSVDLLRTELDAARIELHVDVPADLPAVFADAIQVEQVLVNLLRNSAEEMLRAGSTRREIAVAARRAAEPGFVEFWVEDSGPGFAADMADRIFAPFATTKETGMGLGLSISRSIVEAHGGRIWAVAGRAGGAEIRFTLPAYSEEAAPRDDR